MRTQAVGDLVHLSERRATARFFDSANYQVLRRVGLVATPVAVVLLLLALGQRRLWTATAWLPLLGVSGWILVVRGRPFFERFGRSLTMLYLGLLAASFAVCIPEPSVAYAFAGYLIPALLPFFRLRPVEYLALAGAAGGAMVWSLFRPGIADELSSKVGMATGSLLAMSIILAIAMAVTRRDRHSFLDRWRSEAARERDSHRMRSELEDAREIQLSMLPVGTPQLSWVDFSSVSLPASEVGGDYFDYFEISESELAVVIGDVAGHGVASGLVLSGIRSSLHLLQDRLGDPVEVLDKLDDMLRETVGGRNFVTLQIVVLDRALGTVTVANAGHPPLFLASATGRVSRLGRESLPLGTGPGGDYSEQSARLNAGVALLLFSDGVPEVRDHHGDHFGESRLRDELIRSRRSVLGARRLRDALLNVLSRFKGDVEQEDDITIVVVEMLGS